MQIDYQVSMEKLSIRIECTILIQTKPNPTCSHTKKEMARGGGVVLSEPTDLVFFFKKIFGMLDIHSRVCVCVVLVVLALFFILFTWSTHTYYVFGERKGRGRSMYKLKFLQNVPVWE